MSIDITIEATPSTPLSFDDFTRDHLPLVARAVQVIAPDPERADAALTSGMASVFRSWSRQQDFPQAQQHVFGEAVQYCCGPDDESGEPAATTAAAFSIAHHVFDWDAAATMRMLQITGEEYASHIGDQEDGTRLRHKVAQAEPAHVDLQVITGREKSSTRRVIGMAIGAIAALLALGAVAQFVAGPDRAEQAQDVPPIVGVPPERPSFPGENMVLEPRVPVAERTPNQSLITSGIAEGFVGVTATDREAIILSSNRGIAWQRVGSLEIGSSATISRFERVGDHFVLWFTRSESVGPELAVSDDLVNWTVLGLTNEPPPFGLSYETEITDVAVSDDVVLALVSLEIAVDFASLSLGEGYTCGHSITDDAVTVNLCNNSELDVLSFSDDEQLPARIQLFVSRNDQPLERADEPFGRHTQPQLARMNDVFAIADETGIRFATSTDGQAWQASSAQKPSFPVGMSASNRTGQVLGVGVVSEAMLFFNDGPNTTFTRLNQIVADARSDATVLVASTPTRWAAYVYQPDGQAWIAVSDDGLNWNVADAPAPEGTDVRLIASDDLALVQSIDTQGESTIIPVPLP